MASPCYSTAYKVQSFSFYTMFSRVMHAYLAIHVILSCFKPAVSSGFCKKKDVCSCVSETMTVDLSLLKYVKGGRYVTDSPAAAKTKATYLYNPCLPFSNTSTATNTSCDKTLLCQDSGTYLYPLGVPSNVEFSGAPEYNDLTIKYQATSTKGKVRYSIMAVICSESLVPEFKFIDEITENHYNFELHTIYACLPKRGGRISTGSVLVILFFVFLFIYIVGGVLFLRFARGAQGTEMIPNRQFWKDFPLLVRDGVYFVCRGCKAETTYEQI